jgi:hypothetical protein
MCRPPVAVVILKAFLLENIYVQRCRRCSRLPRTPIGAPDSTAVESLPYQHRLASLLSVSASCYSRSYTGTFAATNRWRRPLIRLKHSPFNILREDPRVVPNNSRTRDWNRPQLYPPPHRTDPHLVSIAGVLLV